MTLEKPNPPRRCLGAWIDVAMMKEVDEAAAEMFSNRTAIAKLALTDWLAKWRAKKKAKANEEVK